MPCNDVLYNYRFIFDVLHNINLLIMIDKLIYKGEYKEDVATNNKKRKAGNTNRRYPESGT